MPAAERWPILVLALLAVSARAGEDEVLTIATWGGAYEAAQREVLFEPFERQHGVRIETIDYNGGRAVLDDPPELVDMAMSDAIAACRAGRLQPFDHATLPDGADGEPAGADFIAGALQRCSVTHTVYATVVAYDVRAFSGRRPTRIEDLFDTDAFAGPRALRRTPIANLEWALMSGGVPRQEIYDLLSTPRGLDLAFRRLERLRDHIVWWEDGQTPVELLESGEVVMASGYNGRFFAARMAGDSPIEILWDGQLQEYQTWVVPVGADHPELAAEFIRFATGTERLRELAERLAYGPARRSASRRVLRNPETGVDMRPHIPTHPFNSESAIRMDVIWYARTLERIRQRFDRWLEADTDQ
jgi:putative spermidine/putrescine transport system substrate-binding protein